MILNAKIFLLLGGITTVDSANVTGWLYDNLCINNCEGTTGPTSCTPDGSNAFYTPFEHTGECLLFKKCILSGHSIMSEFPGEDGRHSVVLRLEDGANTTAYELVKNSGITGEFPKVVATFDDSLLSTDADGVPSVSAVTSLTYEEPPTDPWAENPEKYYSGAPTTQDVCMKPSDGDMFNNMCFRSDVEISEEGDMLVIESNGCPDHMSMTGGSNGTVVNENEFPCDVFEFAPGCNKDKPGGCCGKCDGCNACSDKCNACANYCDGGCSSKTCSACSNSCSAVSENENEVTVTEGYTLKYKVNQADATITMEVTYDGEAWVGIAFSEDARMGGSDGIIGSPGTLGNGVPQKYRLSQGFINLSPPEEQTLTDASVEVVDGKTVMRFTKPLVEPNQIPVISGENKMLWAHGGDGVTAIGYHGPNRDVFSLDIDFGGLTCSTCSATSTCGTCSTCSTCSATSTCGTCSTCSTCSATSCGTCSTCSSSTCGTCSSTCALEGCNACDSVCNACGNTGCYSGCCSTETCGTSCSKCDSCSAGKCCGAGCDGKCCGAGCGGKCCGAGCGGKCSGKDLIGKYTPTFQHYTMKIPKAPGAPGDKQLLASDVVGLMYNGVILDSHKQTWAYDMCNGHSDEKHQYHYHIPQSCYLESLGVAFADSPNWWINDAGDQVRNFDDMAAQFPATAPASPVIGMALDGYPIYGLYDENGDLQRSMAFGGSLDECNGKMDSEGNYGYYLSADPPFAPACLKGSKIGTFDYFTYKEKACPKEGIVNTIQFPSSVGQVEIEVDDSSSTSISIYLSVMVSMVVCASAFFF